MSRKSNIEFSKPSDPPFLQAIKSRVGYVPPPTIDAKHAPLCNDSDSDGEEENEELKPQIVVLKSGDLSEEQVKTLIEEKDKEDENKKINEGKITFKAPTKRSVEDSDSTTCSSTKKPASCSAVLTKQSSSKAVCDYRLLSFDDENEES